MAGIPQASQNSETAMAADFAASSRPYAFIDADWSMRRATASDGFSCGGFRREKCLRSGATARSAWNMVP